MSKKADNMMQLLVPLYKHSILADNNRPPQFYRAMVYLLVVGKLGPKPERRWFKNLVDLKSIEA